MTTIEKIRAEIRQKQWNIGVDSANQVIEIIDKYAEQSGWEEMTVPCKHCGKDMTFKIATIGEPCEDCKYKSMAEQEPCDDAIDRAEAQTEIMMFAGNVKSDEEDVYIKVSDAVQLLRELPSVRPQEPKTGHWIYICNSEVNGLKIVKCSECGKRTYGSGRYCPNCGARMVEPQERSDKE